MDSSSLAAKAQGLSDVELALLLCLAANEHCLLQTDLEAIDALVEEIELVARNVFGMASAIIECSASMSLEDFARAILVEKPATPSPATPTHTNRRASAYKFERSYSGDRYQIAQVLIMKNLNLTTRRIQMQALELLRSHRMLTHSGIYSAPKPFLMIALLPTSSAALSKHLNDYIFISHYHTIDDGFPNKEESLEWAEDDLTSPTSVAHNIAADTFLPMPIFSIQDLDRLHALGQTVTISTDVKRYLHDVLTFLRFHRAVASGVTPRATKHLELLVRFLASIHGLAFATPSLVALATRKVYPHRIILTTEDNERSMQYGSDAKAISKLLGNMSINIVIEETLAEIDVPL